MKAFIFPDDIDVNFIFTAEELKEFHDCIKHCWDPELFAVEVPDELVIEFQTTLKKFLELNNKLEKYKK